MHKVQGIHSERGSDSEVPTKKHQLENEMTSRIPSIKLPLPMYPFLYTHMSSNAPHSSRFFLTHRRAASGAESKPKQCRGSVCWKTETTLKRGFACLPSQAWKAPTVAGQEHPVSCTLADPPNRLREIRKHPAVVTCLRRNILRVSQDLPIVPLECGRLALLMWELY